MGSAGLVSANACLSWCPARQRIVGYRRKQDAALDGWLDMAAAGLVAPFARGLPPDHFAVRAAISTAWPNAQAEGQINRSTGGLPADRDIGETDVPGTITRVWDDGTRAALHCTEA